MGVRATTEQPGGDAPPTGRSPAQEAETDPARTASPPPGVESKPKHRVKVAAAPAPAVAAKEPPRTRWGQVGFFRFKLGVPSSGKRK